MGRCYDSSLLAVWPAGDRLSTRYFRTSCGLRPCISIEHRPPIGPLPDGRGSDLLERFDRMPPVRSRRSAITFALAFVLTCLGLVNGARAEVPAEVVRFQTSDGIEIVADYFVPEKGVSSAPGVVLVHMLRADRSSWAPLIPDLHNAGFAVLAIDLRGNGDSGAPRQDELRQRVRDQDASVFHEMPLDVEAAVSWLIARDEVDKSRLGMIGATVGFSVALEYAARDPSIDVVAGLTPGSGFIGMDSNSGALRYGKRPMLLLAVETDRRPIDTMTRMNTGIVGEVVGTGTGHGTRMLNRYPELTSRITKFIAEGVGERATHPVAFVPGEKTFTSDVASLRAGKDDFDARHLRWCSSADEAKERGLNPAP